VRPSALLLLTACSFSGAVGTVVGETESASTSASTGPDDATTLPPSDALLDVGSELDLCQAFGGQEEFAGCKLVGLAPSFDPVVQWAWSGEGDYTDSFVTPLVANLTDDDGNGVIDLCDSPDVVVLAAPPLGGGNLGNVPSDGKIFVLAGDDGRVHAQTDAVLVRGYTPALGDVDRDGAVDIVAVVDGGSDGTRRSGRIVIFRGDGSKRLDGESTFLRNAVGAIALADLEGDSSVEIIVDHDVMDAKGRTRFSIPDTQQLQLPVAADLDVDGVLEIVWGHIALRADGSSFYEIPEFEGGFPHIADFDGDGLPEVLVTADRGLAIIRNRAMSEVHPPTFDGQQRVPDNAWRRPAAIHDFYGDGRPEIAVSAGDVFMAIDVTRDDRFHVEWQEDVAPGSEAAATAFDFLADGSAEALYGDREDLWMFDFGGRAVIQVPRTSVTAQELPIVADVDNDGAAEIVVVSNGGSPAVQVWRDRSDGWVPARRIWNQHTYHVTNIEEDGSLPLREVPAYRRLNTFRTNVQIEGGMICKPEP
jgi:hypothetical protein